MSYVAFIEIPKATADVLDAVKLSYEQTCVHDDRKDIIGYEIDEYGSVLVDVWGSVYEDDLERLQKLFDELCRRYPSWYIKLDWNGLESINPDTYRPLKCLPGSTTPVAFDPYADDDDVNNEPEQGVA